MVTEYIIRPLWSDTKNVTYILQNKIFEFFNSAEKEFASEH